MILITRAQNEAEKLAQILERKNFECILEPMINIRYTQPNWENHFNSQIQSFLATSKNAKRFAPSGYPLAAIPEQGKNSYALFQWILQNLKPEKGKLVYLRGDKISFDLAQELKKYGFMVEEIITYHSLSPENFSKDFLTNLSNIELATFFSKQTLVNFLNLATKNKLQLKKMRILCISEEVAGQLSNVKVSEIHISDTPDLEGMIHKIDEIY